ncbi:MAG TPA: PEP-CTERM sorting domain-containing protein [Bryobacteraceae bacterium]|nr:PEP-CTERM sorting domain-containing protein [Bryobacteraceae bacterium]
MSASYKNLAPGSQGDAYYDFAEVATFTDIVNITGSAAPRFNFTISGNSTASNFANAFWQAYVILTPCPSLNSTCASAPDTLFSGHTGNFSYDSSNTFFGSGSYEFHVQLDAWVCLQNCGGSAPAAGTNLSGIADYNDTLKLDSVTLAPGETMVGQSGIDYSKLNAPTTVPEPGSIVLLFSALVGLVSATRRRAAD